MRIIYFHFFLPCICALFNFLPQTNEQKKTCIKRFVVGKLGIKKLNVRSTQNISLMKTKLNILPNFIYLLIIFPVCFIFSWLVEIIFFWWFFFSSSLSALRVWFYHLNSFLFLFAPFLVDDTTCAPHWWRTTSSWMKRSSNAMISEAVVISSLRLTSFAQPDLE